MTSQKIRQTFIDFFVRRGHAHLPAASLIPQGDPSVLFTSAGMQQFKPYYTNPEAAPAKNAVTIQPCLRTSDIQEVGDPSHLTFFEMLGNFSFGGYYKQDAISWAWRLLTHGFKIPAASLRVTVFEGDQDIPQDNDSLEILDSLGIARATIGLAGRQDNFWGPTGDEGPCGPTVEFHVKVKTGLIEVWNLVFNEYFKTKDGSFEFLKTKGVDTGAGLERLALVLQNKKSVFETDLFEPIMVQLANLAGSLSVVSQRIIADHLRSIVFLITQGLVPSNKEQGYVLRRLIRSAMVQGRLAGVERPFLADQIKGVIEIFGSVYPTIAQKQDQIALVIRVEEERFRQTLTKGLGRLRKIESKSGSPRRISGQEAFLLQESFGLPYELIVEVASHDGFSVDQVGFNIALEAHRQSSKTSQAGVFKGGLVEITADSTRLHSAHHLLLAAARQVLGSHVVQRGSNITSHRLRIDIAHNFPIEPEQISQIEQIVNQAIADDLAIEPKTMPRDEALKAGALAEFGAKYPDQVSVYLIKDKSGRPFSFELCAGPHVGRTAQICPKGDHCFKITQEQSSGAQTRRIRAVIGPS